jgi:hypothetical protein
MRSLVGGRLFKIDHLDRPDQTTAVVIAGQARASQQKRPTNVRFGSKADIELGPRHVRFTPKADIAQHDGNVRFVPKADNIDDVVIIDGFPLPLAGGGLGEGRLQRHVLHSFALREQRQRLLQDHLLEVRRLLVRLERGFVAEHLVEQELRRIGHTPVHRYQLYAGFLARLRKEARDDIGAGVGLTVARPPRHGERQLAVLTGLHVILLSGLALPCPCVSVR